MSDIRFNQWLHNSGTGGISQDSAGHVGIGTTVPTHINALTHNNSILHVGIVSCNTLNAASKIEGSIDDWIIHQDDTNTKFGFPAADQIQFDTGGTNYLKLHRYGSINWVETQADAHLSLANNGSNIRGILIGDGNASSTGGLRLQAGGGSSGFGGGILMYSHANSTNAGGVYIGRSANASGSIIFGNGGAGPLSGNEWARFTGAGSVGQLLIGIDNAVASDVAVQIHGASSGVGPILNMTNDSGDCRIFFGQDNSSGSANAAGQIRYNVGSNSLKIYTAGQERLSIDTNGKIICKAKDQTVGTLDIWGGKTSVSAVDEINAQIRFRSKDTSVSNTDNVGGTIRSITEYSNGAYTGLSFETFRQDRTPQLREALRLDYNGHVKVTHGNLVISTAGNGIDFSAQTTTSASGAAASTGADEILDHYEKGDWDPTIYGHLGGGSFGINSRTGRYIRVGHLVSLWGYINWQTTGGNGVVNIGGLPFTPNNNSQNNVAVTIGSRTGVSYPRVIGQMYHTGYINLQFVDASAPYNSANVSVGALQSTGLIRFSFQYEVA